jgi:hypothetical protein
MSGFETKLVPYEELRPQIRDGDWLLWHPTSLIGRGIALGTSIRQRRWIRYSHASLAGWYHCGTIHRLYNLEMLQHKGGRRVPLSIQVAQYPRSCEVWRPLDPNYNGRMVIEQMKWLLNQPYGWSDFLRLTIRQLCPHAVLPLAVNSDDPDQPLVCSASVSWSVRTGDMKSPCPDKADKDVSPADLFLSGFARYLATPVI